MTVLGLTGGVGMGKSTTAQLLAGFGIEVIDTDVLAREAVEPGQPALAEICEVFGRDIIDDSGHLDRRAVAALVFPNPAQRRRLEAILHPVIRERWTARLRELHNAAMAAVVIPLLFETAAEKSFDYIICSACSAASQRKRLATRGWSEQEIEQRIAAQMPVERKIGLADFVIWTEGSMEAHAAQARRILERIASCGPPEAIPTTTSRL